MKLLRLAERPDLAEQTADLMTAVWPGHYGPTGRGDAVEDVARRIVDDRAAVILDGNSVIGTVALDSVSFGSDGEGPWLVGLCTDPAFRGQGVGTTLTTWAMGRARTEGHPTLFTTTRDAKSIMKRLGWHKVRRVTDQSGSWSVWKVDLSMPLGDQGAGT